MPDRLYSLIEPVSSGGAKTLDKLLLFAEAGTTNFRIASAFVYKDNMTGGQCMIADEQFFYYSSSAAGVGVGSAIDRMARDGSAVVSPWATFPTNTMGTVQQMQIVGTTLFMTVGAGTGASTNGGIWTVDTGSGGVATQITRTVNGSPTGLATDGQHIYVLDAPPAGAAPLNLSRTNMSGLGLSIINSDNTAAVRLGGCIALDANFVYWVRVNVPGIARANLDGSAPNLLYVSSNLNTPIGVQVDSTNIYWTNSQVVPSIFTAPLATPNLGTEFCPTWGNPRSIAFASL